MKMKNLYKRFNYYFFINLKYNWMLKQHVKIILQILRIYKKKVNNQVIKYFRISKKY